jgi:hypothetical protein
MPVARSTLNLQYEIVVVDEMLLLHTDTMKQLTIIGVVEAWGSKTYGKTMFRRDIA